MSIVLVRRIEARAAASSWWDRGSRVADASRGSREPAGGLSAVSRECADLVCVGVEQESRAERRGRGRVEALPVLLRSTRVELRERVWLERDRPSEQEEEAVAARRVPGEDGARSFDPGCADAAADDAESVAHEYDPGRIRSLEARSLGSRYADAHPAHEVRERGVEHIVLLRAPSVSLWNVSTGTRTSSRIR
jgi:hypothetical protein